MDAVSERIRNSLVHVGGARGEPVQMVASEHLLEDRKRLYLGAPSNPVVVMEMPHQFRPIRPFAETFARTEAELFRLEASRLPSEALSPPTSNPTLILLTDDGDVAAHVPLSGSASFDWSLIKQMALPQPVRSDAAETQLGGMARALLAAYAAGRAEGVGLQAAQAQAQGLAAVAAPLAPGVRPAAEHGLTAASLPPAARARDRFA